MTTPVITRLSRLAQHTPTGYKHYGFNRGTHEGKTGIWYREWAPGAKALALVGEFNSWSPRDTDWAFKNQYGVWELFLPDNPDGTSTIPHRCVQLGPGLVWGWGRQPRAWAGIMAHEPRGGHALALCSAAPWT